MKKSISNYRLVLNFVAISILLIVSMSYSYSSNNSSARKDHVTITCSEIDNIISYEYQFYLDNCIELAKSGEWLEANKNLDYALELDPYNHLAYWTKSDIMFNINRLSEALELATKAINLKSDESKLYIARAKIYFQMGLYKEALTDLDNSLKLSPKNLEAIFQKLIILLESNRSEEALELVNSHIKAEPSKAEFYQFRGGILFMTFKKPEEAYADYCKAISLGSQEPFNYYHKAIIESENFLDNKKSLQTLDEALELEPKYFYANARKAHLLEKENKFEQAGEYWLKCLEVYENDWFTLLRRANNLFVQKKPAEAIEVIDKALKLNPTDLESNLLKADILREAGNFKESTYYYNLALDLGSDNILIPYYKGLNHFNLGEYYSALSNFGKYLDYRPYSTDALLNQRNCLYKLGQFSKALEINEKLIKIDPVKASNFQDKANLYSELGEISKALEAENKAISLNPDDGNHYAFRAYLLEKQGEAKFEDILEDYNRAIKLNYKEPVVYLNKANLLQDNPAEAIENINKAIELDPNCSNYYFLRSKLFASLGNFHKALLDTYKSIQLDENDPEKHYYKAWLSYKISQFKTSYPSLKKALELGYNSAGKYLLLTINSYQLGKYQEGLEASFNFLKREPFNPYGFYYLGLIYYELNEYAEALINFKKAEVITKSSNSYPYLFGTKVEINPNELIFCKIKANYQLGNYSSAIEISKNIENSWEIPVKLYYYLSLIHLYQGELSKSYSYMSKHIKAVFGFA